MRIFKRKRPTPVDTAVLRRELRDAKKRQCLLHWLHEQAIAGEFDEGLPLAPMGDAQAIEELHRILKI